MGSMRRAKERTSMEVMERSSTAICTAPTPTLRAISGSASR